MDWEHFHEAVLLKVWNCNTHVIKAKMEKLTQKVAAVREESAVNQWLSEDETRTITPAFGDLTMVIALQLDPSKRRGRTGGNTRYASLENIVNNLDLNGDGSLTTVAGDDLWLSYGPQSLEELATFIGKVIRASNGKNLEGTVLKTLIEENNPKLDSEGILEYMLTYPPEFECGVVNNNSDSGPTTKSTGTNTTRSDRTGAKERS